MTSWSREMVAWPQCCSDPSGDVDTRYSTNSDSKWTHHGIGMLLAWNGLCLLCLHEFWTFFISIVIFSSVNNNTHVASWRPGWKTWRGTAGTGMCSSVLQLAGGWRVAPPVGSREDSLPWSHMWWDGSSTPSSSQTADRTPTGRDLAGQSVSRLFYGSGSHHGVRTTARTHR